MREGRILGCILGLLILGATTALVFLALRGGVTGNVVGLLIFAAIGALVFVVSLLIPADS